MLIKITSGYYVTAWADAVINIDLIEIRGGVKGRPITHTRISGYYNKSARISRADLSSKLFLLGSADHQEYNEYIYNYSALIL